MKITSIKAQVKNPERVSVYVDEKYALSLNYAQVLDLKLRIGLEVDNQQLADFKKASDFGKAYERALNYAMIRPRSVKELRDYCWRKKWPPDDYQVIIDKLMARHYVDDHNFAQAWIENRALAGKTSLRKLRLELKQKGITDDITNTVLQQTGFNERTALEQLVAKKRKLSRYQDESKLMQYLARQGFSFDDIKAVLREG